VIIEGTGITFELKFLPLKNPFSEPLTEKFCYALLLVWIYLIIRALCFWIFQFEAVNAWRIRKTNFLL